MLQFQTRLNRAGYFGRLAGCYGVLLAATLTLFIIRSQSDSDSTDTATNIVMGLIGIISFVYIVSLAKCRANDISEKYALILTLGLLIFPWGLLLALKGSQPTANRYGSLKT